MEKHLRMLRWTVGMLGCAMFAFADSDAPFEDATAEADVKFIHTTGEFRHPQYGHSRYMPETMGSGVVIFDADGDGDNDILLINSTGFKDEPLSSGGTMSLLRNDGNWNFSDITKSVGLDCPLYGMGAAVADYDADGDPDILVTTIDGANLFENVDGSFHNVSIARGLRLDQEYNAYDNAIGDWSTGAVFFDADGDLDLDIVTINYVAWSTTSDIFTTYDTRNKGYTSPRSYRGQKLRLWLQKDGHFVDASSNSGLAIEGKSLGIALWDFNNDHRLDIVVANDTVENFLFENLGDGKFVDVALPSGVALDLNGNTRAGMGIDVADYNNDGRAAIAIGNFSGEPTSFFRERAIWRFSEDSLVTNIAAETTPLLTFGLLFIDVDLDGWQDIISANGHVEPNIARALPNERYEQPIQWLKNAGNKRFVSAGNEIPALASPMVGRGLAAGDLDADGDLDLVVTGNGSRPRFIRNNIAGRNFIRVKLIGKSPNLEAIGGRIWVYGSTLTQQRIVRTGSSYLSQSEFTQTFGLPDGEHVKAIKILWPNKTVSYINNPPTNITLKVQQAKRTLSYVAR